MSNSDVVIGTLNYLIPLIACVYPSYWAFDIRHSLNVGLYRNQALGLGIFSLVIYLAVLPSPAPSTGGVLGSDAFLIGYFLVTAVFWLGTIYFVDSTVLASRRSDPLLRDTAHWSKIRYIVWGVQIFNVSFVLLGTIIAVVTRNSGLLNQIMQGNNNLYFANFPAAIASLAWALSFGSFVLFVPVAIRAKDPTIRRHLKWLVILASATLLFFLTGAISILPNTPGWALLGSALYFIVLGYCLYRSARALVPINKISRSELASLS